MPPAKVLLDQLNNVSLVALLQELVVEIPEPPVSAPSLRAALKWDAFSLWLKTEDDEHQNYEQRVALFDPSDRPTGIEAATSMTFGGKLTFRSIVTTYGFPISAMGRYLLKLWIARKGSRLMVLADRRIPHLRHASVAKD